MFITSLILLTSLCVFLEETGELPKQSLEEVTINVVPAKEVEPNKDLPDPVTVAPPKPTYRFVPMYSLCNVSALCIS